MESAADNTATYLLPAYGTCSSLPDVAEYHYKHCKLLDSDKRTSRRFRSFILSNSIAACWGWRWNEADILPRVQPRRIYCSWVTQVSPFSLAPISDSTAFFKVWLYLIQIEDPARSNPLLDFLPPPADRLATPWVEPRLLILYYKFSVSCPDSNSRLLLEGLHTG